MKITDEDRQKAKESRLAKKQWAEENLKLVYEDESVWEELAKKHRVRLPQKQIPNTELKYMKRMFKHLGLDMKLYLEDSGVASLKQLVSLNPTWTARAECGMLLEYFDEYFDKFCSKGF